MQEIQTPLDDLPIQARINNFLENRSLSLQRLELRIVELPLIESFQSAIGQRQTRQALLVRWWSGPNSWGIAECACRPDPYYSAEYVAAAWLTIETQIVPLLEQHLSLAQLVAKLDRIRGWEFTRAAVLEAALDCVRRNAEQELLEVCHSSPKASIRAGVSLGIYADPELLLDRIRRAVKEGYQRIKLKFRPGLSPGYLRRVREYFPEIALGLDANGSFGCSSGLELDGLKEIQPVMLEQPFPPDRLDLTQDLRRSSSELRICLDESIHGVGDLKTALLLGAIDELNLKIGRVGGGLASILVAHLAQQHTVPVWIGGMFETGIGRSANLRMAAYLAGDTIHDLSPSSRYFAEDLIESPIRMSDEGLVEVPTHPPAIREGLIDQLSRRVIQIRIEDS